MDRGQPPPDDRPKRSPAEGPLSTGHGSGGGRGSVGPAFDGPNNVILPHPGSLSVRFATLKDGFREPAQGSTAAGWVPGRRSWRVIIIRSRGEYLDSFEAFDRQRAEATVIFAFRRGRAAAFRLSRPAFRVE